MTDKDAHTPRVYIARHGETTWSQNGRYTGTTELNLTAHGVEQVLSTAAVFVGPGKLIDPSNLARVYVSPRVRARKTVELLLPPKTTGKGEEGEEGVGIDTTEEIAEWGYGIYEGLVTGEIRRGRKERGLDGDGDGEWDIWRDGCEGGESARQVSDRLDALIHKIHTIHTPYLDANNKEKKEKRADILIVAHGHILRAFTKRWLRLPLATPLAMMLEPGGIGGLSYAHNNIDEPCFLLGLAVPTT